jgi:hypothetical protein
MDLELARLYNTPGQKHASAQQAENLEKKAQVELFAKLAANNGIDLNTLTDEQIAGLWSDTFGQKLAGEMPPQFAAHMKGKGDDKGGDKKDEKPSDKKDEKDEKKEKEAAAAAEFEAIKADREKVAFFDRGGRIMAHALVAELNSINESAAKEAADKTAAPAAAAAPAAPAIESLGQYALELSKQASAKAAPAQQKQASAIDRLAVERAVEMGLEAKFSAEELGQKLAAALDKGVGESTKIASAADTKQAVEIRALEFLEAAGYPVTWS